jgi:hypothetical protein
LSVTKVICPFQMNMPDRDTVLGNGICQRRTEFATYSVVIPGEDPGPRIRRKTWVPARASHIACPGLEPGAGMTIFIAINVSARCEPLTQNKPDSSGWHGAMAGSIYQQRL